MSLPLSPCLSCLCVPLSGHFKPSLSARARTVHSRRGKQGVGDRGSNTERYTHTGAEAEVPEQKRNGTDRDTVKDEAAGLQRTLLPVSVRCCADAFAIDNYGVCDIYPVPHRQQQEQEKQELQEQKQPQQQQQATDGHQLPPVGCLCLLLPRGSRGHLQHFKKLFEGPVEESQARAAAAELQELFFFLWGPAGTAETRRQTNSPITKDKQIGRQADRQTCRMNGQILLRRCFSCYCVCLVVFPHSSPVAAANFILFCCCCRAFRCLYGSRRCSL